MPAVELLRVLGDSLERALRHQGVHSAIVDTWRQHWALTCADIDDESITPYDAGLAVMQHLTHAHELQRIYGRG